MRDTPPIQRFITSSGPGYSAFWRRDTSGFEPEELAKLLAAIRRIAAYVGSNTGDIVWDGMPHKGGIELDPTPILGSYPIAAAKSDIIIGTTIRKCFRKVSWSHRVTKLVSQKLQPAAPDAYKLGLYLEMAECVYADTLANRSVLGRYTESARLWQVRQARQHFITPPTVAELLHIWWQMAADRSKDGPHQTYRDRSAGGLTERTGLEKFYSRPLKLLNTLADELIKGCPKNKGLVEQTEFRVVLYLRYWPELIRITRFWPGDRGDTALLGDRYATELHEESNSRNAIRTAVKARAKEIEARIPGGQVDFTDRIRATVTNKDEVIRIEFSDIAVLATDKVERHLLFRFQRALKSVATRHTNSIRGLKSGKIDRRRLYRAATTGTAFKRLNQDYSLPHDFTLLIDCSGSMDTPAKWDRCEILYQTLFTALKSLTPRVQLFGYNEQRNTCRITPLHKRGLFHTILPHGKTASGEAVIAATMMIRDQPQNRPLLIHITDGASNWGCGVAEALKFCQRHQIVLLTLGVECHPSDRTALRSEYGDLVRFVDRLDACPVLIEKLLQSSRQM